MSNSKISEKCELFLKYQAEMDPSILIESESKPNMALKKIGHELDIAETKCFTLKSELNYMMGVCRKAEIRRSKGTLETSQELITSSKNSKYTLPTSRSVQFSPRKITDDDNDDAVIEKTTDLKEEKQKGSLNVTITPRAQLDKQFSMTMNSIPKKQFVRCTEQADREYENLLSYYPEEDLHSALNIEDSIEELTSKPDEDYFHVMSTTTRRDLIVGPELNLEISDSVKAKRMEKRKHATRIDKRDTSSFYKASDVTISKRKKRGKLRSSDSKTTIATRNTSFIDKKETKRRKHRGHGAVRQQSNFPKQPNKSSVVEIFHNTTLKNNNSGVFGKYSKRVGQIKKHLIEPVNEKFQEIPFTKRVNHEFHDKKDQQNDLQALNYPNDFKETPRQRDSRSPLSPLNVRQQNKLENHSNESCLSTQSKTQQQCEQAVFNKCNDPTLTPNYEMSTLASRLKRSNRSFFSRYNFQNIPFVVGTSVTPSHNLGLNIQQVLSVMKMRQPIAHNTTPLFIRKVSRGMKPMSLLLQQMNEHDKSFFDTNSQINGLFNNRENSGDYRDKKMFDLQYAGQAQNVRADNMKMLSRENIFRQFQEKNDKNHKSTQQSLSALNKRNVSASMSNQRKTSKLSLNKEDNIGDYKIHIPGSHNSKEIRDILINLHDQFEEMNTKYEKLQSEVKKTSNDVSLTKELSALEKELNVKEEEISAVIGLYKEVMILKQQMKMLHEKNSFVCIESPKTFDKNFFPISIVRDKCQLMNPTQIFERKATRKPPISMQLTALLRQIQAFHKQLQIIS